MRTRNKSTVAGILTTPHSPLTRKGAAAVETAIVLMVCLVFCFAIFEYGRFLMLTQMANNAVREGARQAVAGTNNWTTSDIQNTVMTYLAGQQLLNSKGAPLQASDILVYQANSTTANPASPDSLWTDSNFGSSIVVRINGQFQSMFPTFGFLPKSLTFQATAMMASEAN
jgi:Flp pilus assembly protein TadG